MIHQGPGKHLCYVFCQIFRASKKYRGKKNDISAPCGTLGVRLQLSVYPRSVFTSFFFRNSLTRATGFARKEGLLGVFTSSDAEN